MEVVEKGLSDQDIHWVGDISAKGPKSEFKTNSERYSLSLLVIETL